MSEKVEAMGQPVAYWPEEDDSGVMPAEITSEHKRELPPCRPGWHVPDDYGAECRVCGRPVTVDDQPIQVSISPGAAASLIRVVGEGARAISKAPRTDDTIDDLAIAAGVMASVLREQKIRKDAADERAGLRKTTASGEAPGP